MGLHGMKPTSTDEGGASGANLPGCFHHANPFINNYISIILVRSY